MKVEAISQGFLLLWFIFIAFATLLCLCLLGLCDREWLLFDLLLSLSAEVLIFLVMIRFVAGGIKELEKVEKSVGVTKIRNCNIWAMIYSIVQLFFPDKDFYVSMVYGANILIVASFLFIWISAKK